MINFLNLITKETNKIETTLEDLFIYVDDEELLITMCPIFDILRKCVMLFYAAMKRQNINYVMDFIDPGPTIAVDEKKIRQVFLHLIRNSIEAMPDEGTLHIQAKEEQDSVIISIADTGPGITAEALPHVQEPFFTTKTYGNGMGLALAAQIIDAHHGEFEIRAAKEGGNIIQLVLPKSSDTSAGN